MYGVLGDCYDYAGGKVVSDTYFAIARGVKDAVAQEMAKWFDTNYHYMIQELDARDPELVDNRPLEFYKEAKEKLGIEGKPVILGPITYVKLSKGFENKDFKSVLDKFVPLYTQVLKELADAGAEWVQIDEPIFSTNDSDDVVQYAQEVYETFNKEVPGIKVLLQTYFERIF